MIILAFDDMIERRRGKCIAAKSLFRDAVRSFNSDLVKASGLRWMNSMLLIPGPWAGRVRTLPFLTAPVPFERACRERGRRPQTIARCWPRLALQTCRWLPSRERARATKEAWHAKPKPTLVDALAAVRPVLWRE